MLHERAVLGDRHRPHRRVELDRPAAREPEAVGPIARLPKAPAAVFQPGCEHLRSSRIVVLVVGEHGSVGGVEADRQEAVEEPAAGGHRIDDLAGAVRDRHVERRPITSLPVDEIPAAGVAHVVACLAVGGVTPDPGQMEDAVGAQDRPVQVGVHRLAVAPARRERLVEQPPPRAARRVVSIQDLITVAARAVPVHEDEVACRVAEEDRIGGSILTVARHVVQRLKRVGREGRADRVPGSEVDQRRDVHVGGEVHEAVAIDRHGDGVVAVPAGVPGQGHEAPGLLAERPYGHGEPAVGIVEADDLAVAGGDQREADGMRRPDRSDIECRALIGRCDRERSRHERHEQAEPAAAGEAHDAHRRPLNHGPACPPATRRPRSGRHRRPCGGRSRRASRRTAARLCSRRARR